MEWNLPFPSVRWPRNPAGELFCLTSGDELEDPPPQPPTVSSLNPNERWSPPPPPSLVALTLQVDSEVTEEESAEKYWPSSDGAGGSICWCGGGGWWWVEGKEARSPWAPMTESTAVVRREPGAEPYRVRLPEEDGMDLCEEEDEEEGYMATTNINKLLPTICAKNYEES